MGQSESKRSTKSDILPNLQWCLNELMQWRERAHEAGCPNAIYSIAGAPHIFGSSRQHQRDEQYYQQQQIQQQQQGGGERERESYGGAPSSSSSAPMMEGENKGISGGGNELEAMDAQVIKDKYCFILNHIHRLVTGGEENYIMLCKENWLKNQQSKINISQQHGPTQRADLEKKINENSNELGERLGYWDNARMAIQWLQRHYDLLVQRKLLGKEITDVNTRVRKVQSETPSGETLEELRYLKYRLSVAQSGVLAAYKAANQLRKDSLVVGLQYLDQNGTGAIESNESRMNAELFTKLDIRNKHRITPSDLLAAVDKMEKNIESATNKIMDCEAEITKLSEEQEKVLQGVPSDQEAEKRRLRAEEIGVEINKKRDHVNDLKKERSAEENSLKSTHSMFQQAFVDSLRETIGKAEEKDKYDQLGRDMDKLEDNIKNLHIAADQSSKDLHQSKMGSGLEKKKLKSPNILGRSPFGGRKSIPSSYQSSLPPISSSPPGGPTPYSQQQSSSPPRSPQQQGGGGGGGHYQSRGGSPTEQTPSQTAGTKVEPNSPGVAQEKQSQIKSGSLSPPLSGDKVGQQSGQTGQGSGTNVEEYDKTRPAVQQQGEEEQQGGQGGGGQDQQQYEKGAFKSNKEKEKMKEKEQRQQQQTEHQQEEVGGIP